MKYNNFDRFLFNTRMVMAAITFWLNNKVPKFALIISVIFFGFLGVQSTILLSQVKPFFIPSISAVLAGSPETPFLIFSWSYVLLFTAVCMQHKQVAFNAALQLYRRFGIKWAP